MLVSSVEQGLVDLSVPSHSVLGFPEQIITSKLVNHSSLNITKLKCCPYIMLKGEGVFLRLLENSAKLFRYFDAGTQEKLGGID